MNLTQKRLKEIIYYNPHTGKFTWISKTSRGTRIGDEAGSVKRIRIAYYRHINIFNRTYMAHRVAVLWMTGKWPPYQVDHINGNSIDNRWENLRLATQSQNMANNGPNKSNAIGIKGVSWNQFNKGWIVYIKIKSTGKNKFAGSFANKTDAAICYNYNAAYLHGEFAFLNKIENYTHD